MPQYPSAAALLSDARLRLDALAPGAAILVLEGFDDRRLFALRAARPQQLLVAGGKRLLLAAHEQSNASDRTRIAFVTDCDNDVPRGLLHGAANLIITQNRDIESDLLAIGGLESVLIQNVLASSESEDALANTAADVMRRVTNLAEPIGRVRNLVQARGEELNLDNLNLSKVRNRRQGDVDVPRLVTTIVQRSSNLSATATEVLEGIQSVPGGYAVCNGHDLLAALHIVLRDDYGAHRVTVDHLADLLRTSVLDDQVFGRWSVADRLMRWESANRRQLLRH